MEVFFAIIVVLGIIYYYSKKNKPKTEIQNNYILNPRIEVFRIKGMEHKNLDPKNFGNEFIGYVKADPSNKYDKYAVSIYDHRNIFLGYIPRENKEISNALIKHYKGSVFSWGEISYQGNNTWQSYVFIPIDYDAHGIETFKKIFYLKNHNKKLIKKAGKPEEYFEILNNHQKILALIITVDSPKKLYYNFNKSILNEMSIYFEENKEWKSLVTLEKEYSNLLQNNLKAKSKVFDRIRKAKEILE